MNKKGFTLAEVLITLSILGVVAAIMIPNIIQNYQKRLTITKLKKAYAVLENATQNIAVNSGCIGKDLVCAGLLDITNKTTFRNKFIELSELRVKNVKSGVNYKILNSDNVQSSSSIRTLDSIIVTQDDIAYSVGLSSELRTTGLDVPEKGILITVITSLNFYNDKTLSISDSDTKPYSSRLIDGKNIFHFILWGNFDLDPAYGGFGSKICPLSVPASKWCNSDWIRISCTKNDNHTYPINGCMVKIIQDGWKINYW